MPKAYEPKVGDYVVFHDDPREVLEIASVSEVARVGHLEASILLRSRVDKSMARVTPSRFKEFYTRILGEFDDE